MEPVNREAREHAVRQWTQTPCGLEADYAETERVRYETYPWLRRLLAIEAWGVNRVLEVGPGVGTDLKQFARAGACCYAVDITQAHLDHTVANLESEGYTVDARLGDATALPFGDGLFDVVLCNGVLHHIPEDAAVVAEFRRVLRPGGRLILLVYNRWSWFTAFKALIFISESTAWRLGWAGHLATLERGADGVERRPFIRLYTRRMLGRLLRGWAWRSRTYCGHPMADRWTWRGVGGWFHAVVATIPATPPSA